MRDGIVDQMPPSYWKETKKSFRYAVVSTKVRNKECRETCEPH